MPRSITLVFRGPRDGLLGTSTLPHVNFQCACIIAGCSEGAMVRALRRFNIDVLMPLDGGKETGK